MNIAIGNNINHSAGSYTQQKTQLSIFSIYVAHTKYLETTIVDSYQQRASKG